MKRNSGHLLIISLIVLALGSFLLAACQRPGTSTASTSGSSSSSSSSSSPSSSSSTPSSSGSSGATVHLGDSNFLQSSVTISKGSMLTLVDDASVVHIIENGSWVNGTPKPMQEPGAPTVNVQFQGNDTHQVGPFNTAGTFHLYCTVHPGMNLTVIVK